MITRKPAQSSEAPIKLPSSARHAQVLRTKISPTPAEPSANNDPAYTSERSTPMAPSGVAGRYSS